MYVDTCAYKTFILGRIIKLVIRENHLGNNAQT